ncbi:zinc finger protein 12-like [Bradysia coprophila]|uniref:zinc finger protein 12-like n=1 Tax=Bradysia coprophila TaxID=38358 RepID=UPI00187D9095|nr:zinc finger protein 12-like [Bradysia coprophila]
MELCIINDPLNYIEPKDHHKFGEIYCNYEGKLTFHCVLCPAQMKEATEFTIHYMVHFKEVFVVKTEDDKCLFEPHIGVDETVTKSPSADKTKSVDEPTDVASSLKLENCSEIDCDDSTAEAEMVEKKRKHKRERSKRYNRPIQQCHLCGKDFVSKIYLDRHIENHAWFPSIHECDICGRKIKEKKDLMDHMRHMHTGIKFPCKICGKEFSRSSYVHMHMRMHNEIRPYQCAVCGKTFVMTGALTSHMRKHNNTMTQCPCPTCGKIFNRPGALADHVRVHTGEKPFKCDICQSSFRTRKYLNEHKTIHLTEKNHSCDLCGMKFKQQAGVRVHKRKVHGKKVTVNKRFKLEVDP